MDTKKLKALELENTKLKKLLAEEMLNKQALQDLLSKKLVTPARRREAVAKLKERHGFSERRACREIGASRRRLHYCARKNDDALRVAMKRIAAERRRFGYKRLAVMLRREGFVCNLKKIYRIYREEGLMFKRRKGRKRAIGTRLPLPKPDSINQV